MNLDQIQYCPGTLAEGYNTYSPACLKKMFNGKKISHILNYDSPEKNDESAEKFIENRKRISISGVQTKISLILEKNILRLTEKGENIGVSFFLFTKIFSQFHQIPPSKQPHQQ